MTDTSASYSRRGLFFEEFDLNFTALSPGRTITETDIVNFAGMSGDFSEFHTNEVYSAAYHFGKRIAHGLLILSIATGLTIRLGYLEGTTLAFREITNWKFSAPVFIGDTIRIRSVVQHKQPVPRLSAGMLTFQIDVLNQDDKVVQTGTWKVLVKSKN